MSSLPPGSADAAAHEAGDDGGFTTGNQDAKPSRSMLRTATLREKDLNGPLRLDADLRKVITECAKCVICMCLVREARIVVPCMHRFCKECIEQAHRKGDRKCCPACRTPIPSRRSAKPDPAFDAIMESICGDLDEFEAIDDVPIIFQPPAMPVPSAATSRGGQDKSQQRSKTTAGPSRSEPPAKRQKLDLSRKRSSATDEENDKIIEHLKSQAATGDPITVSLLPGPGMRTDKVFTFQASGSSSIKDIQYAIDITEVIPDQGIQIKGLEKSGHVLDVEEDVELHNMPTDAFQAEDKLVRLVYVPFSH